MSKNTEEKSYCELGEENGCPHLEFCYSSDVYSIGVKKISNREILPKKSIEWKLLESGERFACYNRIKEPKSSLSLERVEPN